MWSTEHEIVVNSLQHFKLLQFSLHSQSSTSTSHQSWTFCRIDSTSKWMVMVVLSRCILWQ